MKSVNAKKCNQLIRQISYINRDFVEDTDVLFYIKSIFDFSIIHRRYYENSYVCLYFHVWFQRYSILFTLCHMRSDKLYFYLIFSLIFVNIFLFALKF